MRLFFDGRRIKTRSTPGARFLWGALLLMGLFGGPAYAVCGEYCIDINNCGSTGGDCWPDRCIPISSSPNVILGCCNQHQEQMRQTVWWDCNDDESADCAYRRCDIDATPPDGCLVWGTPGCPAP